MVEVVTSLVIANLIITAVTPLIIAISETIKHVKKSKCANCEIEMDERKRSEINLKNQ